MKYIRMEDGIYERDKVDFAKQILISVAPKGTDDYKKLFVRGYTEEELILGYSMKLYCNSHHINCKDFMASHDFKKEVIDNENILKSADTIEELCDEFVIVGSGWYQLVELKRARYNCDKGMVVYGAIWTEWGLKYVAFINDKGEFKLL